MQRPVMLVNSDSSLVVVGQVGVWPGQATPKATRYAAPSAHGPGNAKGDPLCSAIRSWIFCVLILILGIALLDASDSAIARLLRPWSVLS